MTSGRDVSRDNFDQRLAEARDSILFDGESILAQEMGDQGQAVVLTQSRILIIKAGLTATGEMNGQKTAAYVFGDIESVKLRKGPMGAVIQICTTAPQAPSPGNPPMNVVVFGDPQKVKRSEALAEQIEAAMGKPVDRIEPGGKSKPVEATLEPSGDGSAQAQPDSGLAAAQDESSNTEAPPATPVVDLDAELEQIDEPKAAPKKGGREARSLADEMFSDMSTWTPPVVPVQPETPVSEPSASETSGAEPKENPWQDDWTKSTMGAEQVHESIIDSISGAAAIEAEPAVSEAAAQERVAEEPVPMESEPMDDFRPNPNLPKPMKKQKQTSSMLVLLGILGVLVIAGLAVMAPLKKLQVTTPTVDVDVSALTRNSKLLQSELQNVIQYKAEVETLLAGSNTTASRIQAALGSGNAQSAASTARNDASGKALAKLGALKTPAGLAAARADIVSGLFTRKNASSAVTGSMVAGRDALRKFEEANRLIKRGLDAIDTMQQDLDRQITEQDTQQTKK